MGFQLNPTYFVQNVAGYYSDVNVADIMLYRHKNAPPFFKTK
jgi:hypothetical protein